MNDWLFVIVRLIDDGCMILICQEVNDLLFVIVRLIDDGCMILMIARR